MHDAIPPQPERRHQPRQRRGSRPGPRRGHRDVRAPATRAPTSRRSRALSTTSRRCSRAAIPGYLRLRHAVPRRAPHAGHDARDGAPGRRPRPRAPRRRAAGRAPRRARRGDRAAARLGLHAPRLRGRTSRTAPCSPRCTSAAAPISSPATCRTHRLRRGGGDRRAPGAFHRLRDGHRRHQGARPEGPPARLHGRHRRPDRPDVGPHVPGEMPRVPVPGVRARARSRARRCPTGARSCAIPRPRT